MRAAGTGNKKRRNVAKNKPASAGFLLRVKLFEKGVDSTLNERIIISTVEMFLTSAPRQQGLEMKMELKFRILRIDGKCETKLINANGLESAKYVSDVLVPLCSKIRSNDPGVAKIKIDLPGYDEPYSWIGNATKDHMEAIAKSEKENMVW